MNRYKIGYRVVEFVELDADSPEHAKERFKEIYPYHVKPVYGCDEWVDFHSVEEVPSVVSGEEKQKTLDWLKGLTPIDGSVITEEDALEGEDYEGNFVE